MLFFAFRSALEVHRNMGISSWSHSWASQNHVNSKQNANKGYKTETDRDIETTVTWKLALGAISGPRKTMYIACRMQMTATKHSKRQKNASKSCMQPCKTETDRDIKTTVTCFLWCLALGTAEKAEEEEDDVTQNALSLPIQNAIFCVSFSPGRPPQHGD